MKVDKAIELPGLGQIHLRTLLLMQLLSTSCNSLSASLWLALVFHMLTVVFGFLGARPSFFTRWIGEDTIGSMSAKYLVYLTPATWTFGIWGVIFISQAVWIIYVLVSYQWLQKAYFNHIGVLPVYLYTAACVFNLAWLLLWLKGRFISSFVAIVFMSSSLHSSYSIMASNIDGKYSALSTGSDDEADAIPQNFKSMIRLLVINSLALYFTWSMLATILNFQIMLVHQYNYTENKSTFICLIMVLAFMLSRFIADISAQAISNRYIITPYVVIVFYLVGTLSRHRHDATHTDIGIYLIVLFICSIFFLLAKLFLAFYPLRSRIKDFNLLAENAEF